MLVKRWLSSSKNYFGFVVDEFSQYAVPADNNNS